MELLHREGEKIEILLLKLLKTNSKIAHKVIDLLGSRAEKIYKTLLLKRRPQLGCCSELQHPTARHGSDSYIQTLCIPWIAHPDYGPIC